MTVIALLRVWSDLFSEAGGDILFLWGLFYQNMNQFNSKMFVCIIWTYVQSQQESETHGGFIGPRMYVDFSDCYANMSSCH